MKKLFAVLVALALVLSMGTIVFAADATTGTIIIKNTVSGVTYSVYQMFTFEPVGGEGSTNGIYRYASDDWKAFVETGDGAAYLEIDEETGSIKWKGTADAGTPDATEVAALAKAAVAYAIENEIEATASKEAEGTTVTFGGLALGYYAIDTTLGALCGLTTTDSTFEMTEKNEKPNLEKKILEDGVPVDANNVNIGDTVTYQATITIGTGAQNYVMHDKMSDTLEYKAVTSVTVNNIAVDEANYTIIADPDDDCTFEIAFDDAYTATLAKGTAIVVTYTAVLNENAVVGAEGNPNEAWLEYGDKNETTHEFVITYTTSFTVEKVDGNNAPLAGAGFTLYKLDADNNWVEVGEEKVITTLAADEKAIYEWIGLEEGQYKLVETTVPAGYNKAADIEFTITCTEVYPIVSGTETADWAVTVDDNKVVEENDKFKATVVNRTGSLLPETGGIGTTIFYVVGGLLMVAAFIILVSKKRMASFA